MSDQRTKTLWKGPHWKVTQQGFRFCSCLYSDRIDHPGASELSLREYQIAVAPYQQELSEGGCHNVGANPDNPVQRDVHDHLTSTYGWPILTSEAVSAVVDFVGSRGVVDFGIYAGEILRRTADPSFHRELAANWQLVERITIPQWRNFSDAIYLFERREGAGVGWDWMLAE